MKKIKVNTVAHINVYKIARLTTNNSNNKTNNMANNNNKNHTNFIDINLVEFDVYNNILLVNSIKKTCYK